jgi:hypothetical protein
VTALSTGAAFDALFDDAAIFPPGNLPMRTAVQQHAAYRCGDRAWLVGPFVCSAARLPELDAVLGELDHAFAVSVVNPAGSAEITASDRVRVVSIEKAFGADVPRIGTTYVEFPSLPVRAGDLAGLAGARVKFRTGGPSASDFPSESSLASAIRAALDAGVAFKCTAGLHNAVRHTATDGFERHGFLNVLLGTHAAVRGGDVAAVLAERDGATLAAALRAVPEEELARTREVFCSLGTCSIDEPVADLQRLGLLA